MSKNIRVLLVDDEERYISSLAKILANRGFDVSTALNGYQAIDNIKFKGKFDVVVLDVKMPHMDGIAVLDEIKKWTPDTEVIMLTGNATIDTGMLALRKGAYDYLLKPCDIEDLVEKIEEAYEKEFIKHQKVLCLSVTVKEIPLRDFRRINPKDTLVKAIEMMRRNYGDESVNELFVLDRKDSLLGIVTKRDILSKAQELNPEISLTWTTLTENSQIIPVAEVRSVMKTEVFTTHPDELITDLINRMLNNKIQNMPVIIGKKMAGVIRTKDIFQYMERKI